MKPINITKETKLKIFENFVKKFTKEMDDFSFNVNDTKISFSFDLGQEAKEKITVLYSQKAYLRTMALVANYDTEVGWYGLCKKLNDKLYYIYDIKVCKQYVNGGKVDTDDAETLAFFESLSDEEAEHMHFQAHSHVNMSTIASGVDLQNQADVVHNMGKTGFYIFQIWNKRLDINTYLYDLDENMFYDQKDVVIEIEDDEGTISDFVASTESLVVTKTSFTYYKGGYTENKTDIKKKENIEKEEDKQTKYLGEYWDGVHWEERWNW